ncbi:Holliday junction branch migration protein RuvA [Microbacterium terricola]|uniref:Holliday junction branch migration complex subunit RuvA n=1 Tax=Microbacterium terricola TaxID=344163 RepID=A0ABM8DYG6_9MICO|nr:Holliday junction branch migration protein RuvA [Microbacterium terricola]UYK38700.1 Holliday junction branch migration protein RuvA [Microbacterium terricola]BDV30612.1 Holliday junction ATP-dependent DNA helicase RuvA [Microbacterium terricola]
MISSLRGRAVHVDAEAVVVEVGGIGLSVAVPAPTARAVHLGDEVHLHTHLVVREDALALFGFDSREELTVFTLLISVTGVGPKSALGVLSTLTVPQIADAVSADDDAPFRRVSGIGPKTAKLIVVQLAGKITAASAVTGSAGTATTPDVIARVAQALMGLGWSERTAADAVATVAADAAPADRASVPALLRLTLAALGPARQEAARG